MKLQTKIIIGVILALIVGLYIYFRSKAQKKGYSNSKFYASLFAVPYQDPQAEVLTSDDFTLNVADDINQEFEEIFEMGAF